MEWLMYPIFILAILFFNIAISEWLERTTKLRIIGTALLVILLTALTANLGIIPSSTPGSPIYDGIFKYVAPLAIFYLLLDVNLKNLKDAGAPMLIAFALGTVGTTVGVLIADAVLSMETRIGPDHIPLAGMFAGTYIGGSINFNAIALHFEIHNNANLYATTVAIDNVVTAIWMGLTIALPRIMMSKRAFNQKAVDQSNVIVDHSKDEVDPISGGVLLGIGLLVLLISESLADWLQIRGISVPSILILTTIAIFMAQFRWITRFKGYRFFGIFGVYLFLAVIGAYCDLGALADNGRLAAIVTFFVLVIISVHGLVIFGLGAIFKLDWNILAIASQANIGGSTSAMALAKSNNVPQLILPAILVGTLGNGIGTYIGFLLVGWL